MVTFSFHRGVGAHLCNVWGRGRYIHRSFSDRFRRRILPSGLSTLLLSPLIQRYYPRIEWKLRYLRESVERERKREISVTHEGKQWLREEWNLLKSPVPHVRPIETIWSCNKPCCEPVYRLVGSETLCTASCTGHIIIMPPLTRLAVITTLPPPPSIPR